jgi:hypothetical protein
MSKIVGDIAVTVGANVSGLQAGMRRGKKSVKAFESSAADMGKRVAKVSVGIVAAGTAMAAGLAKMASSASKSAKEISNLSKLSGVGVVEFQKLAAAGEAVGFSGEKMADIFKDVNDKFGDFISTGAGPLKDFFENIGPKVGVTADQFARLSGPEALQLYVTSLERAGVSQQQMTFYMEALANDATALVPLLRNNGVEMRKLGDEADRSGRIMSRQMIENGVKLDRKMTELAQTMKAKATAAILEYSDELIALADWIADVGIPAIASLASSFASFAETIQPAIDAIGRFLSLAQAAAGVEVGSASPSASDQSRYDADSQGLGGR